MSDLIKFLTARLDDDEAWLGTFTPDQAEVCQPFTMDRQRDEIGAKRAILTAHRITDGRCHVCTAIAGGHATRFRAPCPTLYFLAAIYSDHPDYREATAE